MEYTEEFLKKIVGVGTLGGMALLLCALASVGRHISYNVWRLYAGRLETFNY